MAIATPDALAIVVTAVPETASVRVGRPPTYWGLGHIAPGGTSGYQRDRAITHVSQLELLGAREFTLLGYTLADGVTITVTELTSSLLAPMRLPIDRGRAEFWAQFAYTSPPASGEVINYSWAVPPGRALMIQSVQLHASLTGNPTNPAYLFTALRLSGSTLMQAYTQRARLDYPLDLTQIGELLVPAPYSLQLTSGNYNSGTSAIHLAYVWGYTFTP